MTLLTNGAGTLTITLVTYVMNVNVQSKSSISNERYLTNDGDNYVAHSITLTSTVCKSATTMVTSKSEISTTASITVVAEELGLGALFSNTFTFSNEVGSSHTQSTTITVGDTVSVTVLHILRSVCACRLHGPVKLLTRRFWLLLILKE